MRVAISSGLVERIVALAAAEPHREICGLLLGTQDWIEEIVPAANVATDPTVRFEVDPAVQFDVIRAARAGGRALIGCYHSHPAGQATPSRIDAATIGRIGEYWLICDGQKVRAWQADTTASFVEVVLSVQPRACVTS